MVTLRWRAMVVRSRPRIGVQFDHVGFLSFIIRVKFRHNSLQEKSASEWLNEMDGQRRILAKFGNVNEEEIVGLRAPQLAMGGDEQFEVPYYLPRQSL